MAAGDKDLESLLWRALETDLGVKVETNDKALFHQRANKLRNQISELKDISVADSPTEEGVIWLIRRS